MVSVEWWVRKSLSCGDVQEAFMWEGVDLWLSGYGSMFEGCL